MPITQEQADFLCKLVDEDANLSGYNLKLKKVPDYDKWVGKYNDKFPPPEAPEYGASSAEYSDHYTKWAAWSDAREAAWVEEVNKALLPENVVGACVIGGFTIAALKAGYQITLADLISPDTGIPQYDFEDALGSGLYSLPRETKNVLEQFTKLTYRELEELQETNDVFGNGSEYWTNPETGREERNPWKGKKPYQITLGRRKALKNKINSFILEV